MGYTPENNPYVPGDPYSYDLKWVVDQIKAWKDPQDAAAAAKASAEAAQTSAENAEDSAEDSAIEAANAAASANAAAAYANNIADPVAGLVTDWLTDHITNPTSPPVDTSLSVGGAAADAEVTGDRIEEIEDLIGYGSVDSILYGNSDVSSPMNDAINVTGPIPTFKYIGRYNGGFSVDSGHYMIGCKIEAGPTNTETLGTFAIAARRYGTTTIVGTATPSAYAWYSITTGDTKYVIFDINFTSPETIYLYLFGTGHTTGTIWDVTVTNLFMYKVPSGFSTDKINKYFLDHFVKTYEFADRLDEMEEDILDLQNANSNSNIICWGDSLTTGTGGGGTSYPQILASLVGSGYPVYSYGVGGEDAQTIAGRTGAIPYILMPCTLTRDTLPVNVQLKALNGDDVAPVMQRVNEFCLFDIQGVIFKLTYDSLTQTWALRSQTSASGTVTVSVPTPIVPQESKNSALKKAIQLVCAGINGWGSSDPHDLAAINKTIVDHFKSINYLIIGFPTYYNAYSINDQKNIDRILGDTFGQHFVNSYAYLASRYPLDDLGITPTAQDLTDIADGIIPTSLRTDGTHLNASGYTAWARLIYRAGILNEYWS